MEQRVAANVLVSGPAGCGKTHTLKCLQTKLQALYWDCDDATAKLSRLESITQEMQKPGVLLLDNLDNWLPTMDPDAYNLQFTKSLKRLMHLLDQQTVL
mmetsp:Transcript_12212/g.6095  ORF Transcript_12212/g.6095 Transcript_12212/m.6095 type:complete len:99 (+) Transcript_12212:290-586(+)